MNPVMSDLTIRVVQYEAQANLEARNLARLAHRSLNPEPVGSLSRLAARIVDSIHGFVDPRGHAMKGLRELEMRATRPERVEARPIPAPGASGASVVAGNSGSNLAALAQPRCAAQDGGSELVAMPAYSKAA
jgi:hypothetical protein